MSPSSVGSNDPFQAGIAAYEHQDYATALSLWQPLAESGHTQAQINLGMMYQGGAGVKQDYAEAMKWFRRAADTKDSSGQMMVGQMFEMGRGVQKDTAEAFKWYRCAADQGYAPAYYKLGWAFEHGDGVEFSWEEAYFWYSIAAASKVRMPAALYSTLESLVRGCIPEEKIDVDKRVADWMKDHPAPASE